MSEEDTAQLSESLVCPEAGGAGAETRLAHGAGDLEDDDMAEIEDDVYNMFFLSDSFSAAFWYALMVWGLKLGLIIIIALDIYKNMKVNADVPTIVRAAQFLLLPVNVAIQQELITTFFIYANLKWGKQILELNPGATKGKYHFANAMRFIDGLAFLFINTALLLQATEVLSAFLNFAALQFLSDIDNVALSLARDGYLSGSLEEVAGNVSLTKLPRNHNGTLQVLDSVAMTIIFLAIVIMYVLNLRRPGSLSPFVRTRPLSRMTTRQRPMHRLKRQAGVHLAHLSEFQRKHGILRNDMEEPPSCHLRSARDEEAHRVRRPRLGRGATRNRRHACHVHGSGENYGLKDFFEPPHDGSGCSFPAARTSTHIGQRVGKGCSYYRSTNH
ncbi:hypothetical protein THAOC_34526 [Thalassiosira oceanica]|uniref:Uncharacterized protein n=1 Tax=Thalassiosira oceanica TaxID=159749 RepID=K0R4U0_THAOC|nr:hypothetical protein THAOC_34526 [Thalassiosira oceanica]|eukprot:EJK46789.1 hypothetical protein THAOC_34526 [Thalassiosira oceanica]